jgi:hypothetical protein
VQVKHAYSFLCHYEKRDGMVPNLRAHTDREDNQFTGASRAWFNFNSNSNGYSRFALSWSRLDDEYHATGFERGR